MVTGVVRNVGHWPSDEFPAGRGRMRTNGGRGTGRGGGRGCGKGCCQINFTESINSRTHVGKKCTHGPRTHVYEKCALFVCLFVFFSLAFPANPLHQSENLHLERERDFGFS